MESGRRRAARRRPAGQGGAGARAGPIAAPRREERHEIEERHGDPLLEPRAHRGAGSVRLVGAGRRGGTLLWDHRH